MPDDTEPSPTALFHEGWWLDAATDGRWTSIETGRHAGHVARLPVFKAKSLGRHVIKLPPLTRTLGPVIHQVETGGVLTTRVRHTLMNELIAQLPQSVPLALTFRPEADNLYPFFVRGFDVNVEYTFRLPYVPDRSALWSGLRKTARYDVRRAGDDLTVEASTDAREFIDFYERNIRSAGKRMWLEPSRMEKIIAASVHNGSGTALLCRDPAGRQVGAVWLVWDRTWCYFLLSSRDQAGTGNAVMTLLAWKAVEWANDRKLGFDFDGFNRFVVQFGAEPVRRWRVSRMHPFRKAAKLIAAHVVG